MEPKTYEQIVVTARSAQELAEELDKVPETAAIVGIDSWQLGGTTSLGLRVTFLDESPTLPDA